jgi:hypothetical protein
MFQQDPKVRLISIILSHVSRGSRGQNKINYSILSFVTTAGWTKITIEAKTHKTVTAFF